MPLHRRQLPTRAPQPRPQPRGDGLRPPLIVPPYADEMNACQESRRRSPNRRPTAQLPQGARPTVPADADRRLTMAAHRLRCRERDHRGPTAGSGATIDLVCAQGAVAWLARAIADLDHDAPEAAAALSRPSVGCSPSDVRRGRPAGGGRQRPSLTTIGTYVRADLRVHDRRVRPRPRPESSGPTPRNHRVGSRDELHRMGVRALSSRAIHRRTRPLDPRDRPVPPPHPDAGNPPDGPA